MRLACRVAAFTTSDEKSVYTLKVFTFFGINIFTNAFMHMLMKDDSNEDGSDNVSEEFFSFCKFYVCTCLLARESKYVRVYPTRRMTTRRWWSV